MKKETVLVLILVMALSNLFTVRPVFSAVPKPSVPDFSLKLVSYSSDDPAIYGIDPYTGENVTIVPAKHQESSEITITIVNQPFAPYKDSNGNWIELYYSVRSKGHFSDVWNENQYLDVYTGPDNNSIRVFTYAAEYYPQDAEIDFQVQAMIGYVSYVFTGENYPRSSPVFIGETSGWSSTQTIKINTRASTPTPSASSSQNPSATPSQPSFDWANIAVPLIVVVVVVFAVAAALFLRKKRIKQSQPAS